MKPIDIIGMGQSKKDLTQNHLDIINRCDVLVAGRRYLEMFDRPDIQKMSITDSIKNIVKAIKKQMDISKIVVLASGDPLFYGIGSTLIQYFHKEQINIHSNISSTNPGCMCIRIPH